MMRGGINHIRDFAMLEQVGHPTMHIPRGRSILRSEKQPTSQTIRQWDVWNLIVSVGISEMLARSGFCAAVPTTWVATTPRRHLLEAGPSYRLGVRAGPLATNRGQGSDICQRFRPLLKLIRVRAECRPSESNVRRFFVIFLNCRPGSRCRASAISFLL